MASEKNVKNINTKDLFVSVKTPVLVYKTTERFKRITKLEMAHSRKVLYIELLISLFEKLLHLDSQFCHFLKFDPNAKSKHQ